MGGEETKRENESVQTIRKYTGVVWSNLLLLCCLFHLENARDD